VSAVSVEIEGAATLNATTAEAIHGLEDLSAAGAEAGRLVQLRASAAAPKLSGALSRSITAEASGNEVNVSAEAEYAAYVEYGTSRMAAQPYMRPALADSQSAVLEAYAKEVRTEVGKIKGA
jgi:HK97 gp10 family phage protein